MFVVFYMGMEKVVVTLLLFFHRFTVFLARLAAVVCFSFKIRFYSFLRVGITFCYTLLPGFGLFFRCFYAFQ